MRILVTGSDGQLGQALRAVLEPDHEVLWGDLPDLDVRKPTELRKLALGQRPELILHLAACTDVDLCEREPERAFAVNTRGTRNVALAAREVGARMVFVSSDYVFDGSQSRAYQEYDTPAPLNQYGWSKLHGERAVRDLVPEHCVVRTSGLFGPGGRNFARSIWEAQRRQSVLRVVCDQTCRPTYSRDLASALGSLISGGHLGVFHVASQGAARWCDFARAVVQAAGGEGTRVVEISSDELGRPARRPVHSVLATHVFEELTGGVLPHWREGLAAYIRDLRAAGEG
ncbi:MAG: dTDP-4-dehydrorhamnose reductase [Candidatus Eisenbacteria bacterium]|nr:dTDP-4-dehydrorhamnose reductase [Candidatus Eisenbacteria bacterium]